MEIPALFIGVIILAIVIRLAAGSFDGDRVKAYVEQTLKGELLDQSWDPLGPGWFGEKDSRIYEIIYKDQDGNTHRANVKTSMMSGVYLTNDVVIERAQQQGVTSLEEEERQLRSRLDQIQKLKNGERGANV